MSSTQAMAVDPIVSQTKAKKKKGKKKGHAAKADFNETSNMNKYVEGEVEDEVGLDTCAEAPAEASEDESSEVPALPRMENSERQKDDTSDRLDALAKERDALLAEVSGLRRSLEVLTTKHEDDVARIKEQLEDTQSGKEEAESKYEDLRERVTTIRTTLGERLKEYSEEIAHHRAEIESLEVQNFDLRTAHGNLQSELITLTNSHSGTLAETKELRSRASKLQQNWVKERDDLIQREAAAREEFESAAQAMKEWEDLANEERLLRKNLGDRVTDLEEEINNQREAFEKTVSERDSQSQTIDGLQRALKDIQSARKKELRDVVESSQAQLDTSRKQLESALDNASSAQGQLAGTKAELDRLQPLQGEVKEKNLLIGKLRHEAVTLNEHLTKALRFLKKSKPGDIVDRQLVTNHLLQFLAMERSDPKKFQVLQLIASLLGWSDGMSPTLEPTYSVENVLQANSGSPEQKEQAGLSRPGTGNTSLRVPISPFRRTPSSPSLNTQVDIGSTSKDSLAELWSEFLEREAQEGQSPISSRRPSVTSPPLERKESEK